MPWSGLSAAQQGVRDHVSTLTAIRKAHPALSRGNRVTLLADQTGLAYGRVSPADRAVVALNRAGVSRSFSLDVSGVGFSDGQVLVDELSGATYSVGGSSVQVDLDPRQGAILVAR